MVKDMTRGNPLSLIIGFFIPLVLGNLFQQLYNMVDTMVVGRYVGVDALSAVVDITGMVITVDRMEKGLNSDYSAVEEAYNEFGIRVYSIVNMEDIIKAINDGVIGYSEYLDAMLAYREQYGAKN